MQTLGPEHTEIADINPCVKCGKTEHEIYTSVIESAEYGYSVGDETVCLNCEHESLIVNLKGVPLQGVTHENNRQ